MEFVDAGGYNGNESEGNWRLGMGRQRRMEKKNKIKTLDTERCENIKSLYIKKKSFSFFIFNNFLCLFPYIFAKTRQLTITLS